MRAAFLLPILFLLFNCSSPDENSRKIKQPYETSVTQQSGEITMEWMDQTFFFTDIITVKLRTRLNEGRVLIETLPDEGESWGPFEVYRRGMDREGAILFQLLPEATGDLELPSLSVGVSGASGEELFPLPSIAFTIKSSLSENREEPFDLKGPEEQKNRKGLFFTLIPLFLLFAAAGFLWYLKKRKKAVPLTSGRANPDKIMQDLNDLSTKPESPEAYCQLFILFREGLSLFKENTPAVSDPEELQSSLGELKDIPDQMILTAMSMLDRMDQILFSPPRNVPASGLFEKDCVFVRSFLQFLQDQEAR